MNVPGGSQRKRPRSCWIGWQGTTYDTVNTQKQMVFLKTIFLERSPETYCL